MSSSMANWDEYFSVFLPILCIFLCRHDQLLRLTVIITIRRCRILKHSAPLRKLACGWGQWERREFFPLSCCKIDKHRVLLRDIAPRLVFSKEHQMTDVQVVIETTYTGFGYCPNFSLVTNEGDFCTCFWKLSRPQRSNPPPRLLHVPA